MSEIIKSELGKTQEEVKKYMEKILLKIELLAILFLAMYLE